VRRIGLVVALLAVVPGAARAELQETPFFEQDVTGGKLSRLHERLPSDPAVAGLETVGNPGGELSHAGEPLHLNQLLLQYDFRCDLLNHQKSELLDART